MIMRGGERGRKDRRPVSLYGAPSPHPSQSNAVFQTTFWILGLRFGRSELDCKGWEEGELGRKSSSKGQWVERERQRYGKRDKMRAACFTFGVVPNSARVPHFHRFPPNTHKLELFNYSFLGPLLQHPLATTIHQSPLPNYLFLFLLQFLFLGYFKLQTELGLIK